MITRQDFLDHGFKIVSQKKGKRSLYLDKDEIPQELAEQFRKNKYSFDAYRINGKDYTVVSFDESYAPIAVRAFLDGEFIEFEKDGLCILTEWKDGDERLRSAYETNCNSESHWHRWLPLNITFRDLMRDFYRYKRNERKAEINAYRKELKQLRENHKERMDEYNNVLSAINECVYGRQ